jgi:GNAT superfamily N-acetyltransferase
MSTRIEYRLMADLSDAERADLTALSQAVFPPEVLAALPGRHLEWAAPEGRVFVRTGGAGLVCVAGVVFRTALYDGRPVLIGGIGGVMTHPAHRRQGYAAHAVRHALELLRAQTGVAFGLLVCESQLAAYYGRLGWGEFAGRLLVTQRGVPAEFVFNRVMVCEVCGSAPAVGTIDLLGPPW